MTRAIWLLPLVLVLACDGGTDPSDDPSDDGATDTDVADDGLPALTEAPTGDFSCFTPAPTYDAVQDWVEQTLIAEEDLAATEIDVAIEVLDFQEETPTSSRTVELWYDDVAEGAPDVFGNNNDQGVVTLSTPTCQPVSYRTKELPGLGDAVDTFKAHQVFGPTVTDTQFQSVNIDTYLLIPTVLGLSADPKRGVIAGTLYDCNRNPDTLSDVDDGKVEHARVRIFGCPSATSEPAECTETIEGYSIHYFIENFPNRDQAATSPDGLWGVYNVPPGTVRVEAYALIDGEEQVVGATTATVYADTINIANIWAGFAGGVKYPPTCVADET